MKYFFSLLVERKTNWIKFGVGCLGGFIRLPPPKKKVPVCFLVSAGMFEPCLQLMLMSDVV